MQGGSIYTIVYSIVPCLVASAQSICFPSCLVLVFLVSRCVYTKKRGNKITDFSAKALSTVSRYTASCRLLRCESCYYVMCAIGCWGGLYICRIFVFALTLDFSSPLFFFLKPLPNIASHESDSGVKIFFQ